jgi:hypothetical protein
MISIVPYSLGTGNSRNSYVFATWGQANLKTLQQLRERTGVRIGPESIGHDVYIVARLLAWLLNLKDPKCVTRYGSGPEIDLAMANGEVDARPKNPALVDQSSDWIEKKRADFHASLKFPQGIGTRTLLLPVCRVWKVSLAPKTGKKFLRFIGFFA